MIRKIYFRVDRLNNVFSFHNVEDTVLEEMTLLEAEDFADRIKEATKIIKTTEGKDNA